MIYMKKAIPLLMCLIFALTALYPVGTLIAASFGYNFEIINISAFAAIIAILSSCCVIADLAAKNKVENKVIRVLLPIMTPLSFINAAFCIHACPQIWVIASVLLSAGCSCFLTVKHGAPERPQILALAISGVIISVCCFFGYLSFIFGDIRQDTVVQTVESPNGQYYAQVIDSNQGALGGNTLVDVYEKRSINLFLFRIDKKPQSVYYGRWGEFKNMQIYWKNDSCLVINSVEYQIK